MHRVAVILCLFLVSVPWLGLCDEESAPRTEEHVLVLDASNFHDTVKEHTFIVVEFYAPWCGHCKHLAPEYEKAAEILKANDPPIVLAKVNADEESNKELAREFNIQGYPTLKIIENKGSIVRDYTGPREVDGIVSYLKKQVGSPSSEITTVVEEEKLYEEASVVVVGVFKSSDSEEYQTFISTAAMLRSDYTFMHTFDASLLPKKDDVLTVPSIRVYKKFDEGFNDFKEFSSEAVKVFLDEVSIPYVVWFSKDPEQRVYLTKIFQNPADAKVFLFIEPEDEASEGVKKVYEKLAKENKAKNLKFMIADTEDGQNALQYFGANPDRLPTIVIQGGDEKKYMLEKAHVGNLEAWLKDYLDGNASEFLKSEPVPEKNDEPVKIVVLDTLDELVFSSGKNVLLEFYAPWCGHCKNLAPTLEEVAVALQSDPSIVIAKMDATANDIKDERFDIKGFPTLYLYTATGKIVPYDGDRTKEAFLSFIESNKEPVDEDKLASSAKIVTDSKDEL